MPPKLPPGVSLHASGLYIGRESYNKFRYWAYGKTPKEAYVNLQAKINDAKRRELPSETTIGDIGSDWLKKKKQKVRGTSYATTAGYYRKWVEPIADTRIQLFDAQEWVNDLKPLAPATVRKVWVIMRQILRVALVKGIIRMVPDDIVFPRLVKKKIEPQSPDAMAKLIVEAAGSVYASIFTFALYTGLRREEIVPLKWSDLNFTKNEVTIRRTCVYDKGWKIVEEGKTNDSLRTLPVSPDLMKYIKSLPRRCDYVFTGRNPRMVCPSSLKTSWERIKKRAGVEMRWHDLRHQFASDLRLQGVSLDVIQELLGHSSISTTRIYAHLSPSVPIGAVANIQVIRPSAKKHNKATPKEPTDDTDDKSNPAK